MGSNSCVHCFSRFNNSSSRKTIYEYFFIRPKLCVEFSENRELNTFSPERTIISDTTGLTITRKYKRVRIRNKGKGLANNCRARLRVIIPKSANLARYTSDDYRILFWEGTGIQENVSVEKNIQPKEGLELVHVVFSDTRFRNASMEGEHKFASISTNDSSNNFKIVVEDGFAEGDFIIEIIITSDERATKIRFRVHVDQDFMGLPMNKLSRFENLKVRLGLPIF
jgi:hypothetical protein